MAPSKNTAAWTTCSHPKIDVTALDEIVYLSGGLSIQADLTTQDSVGPEPSAVAALRWIITFRMAEVAVSKDIWAELLSRIDRLRWMKV